MKKNNFHLLLALLLSITMSAFILNGCSDGDDDDDDESGKSVYNAEACIDAIAFPIVVDSDTLEERINEKLTDIDLSESTDEKPCGPYMIEKAKEVFKEALLAAGMPEEEIKGFGVSYTYPTSDHGEEVDCYSLDISLRRVICDVDTSSGDAIYAEWTADGKLKHKSEGGGGLINYGKPETDCESELWTLETCGDGSEDEIKYMFYFNEDDSEFIKGIMLLCESNHTDVGALVCDDILDGEESVCVNYTCP